MSFEILRFPSRPKRSTTAKNIKNSPFVPTPECHLNDKCSSDEFEDIRFDQLILARYVTSDVLGVSFPAILYIDAFVVGIDVIS
ncbi:uncharacterized protein Bfra_009093 [Botrytis fragariae]|uniref:Uncharacterized protein n=1 Tax=Botrytis fragariae TaxID=1964551 RepID=A0A8H6ARJ0_9HELO|nr:uncharacterized protein Bfra_009093 [Botrytis fragariae]KAF5872065.1 hypothetical protein Bfra_009093 [Botrytis fragariae]